jgi:hypothetical protein
MQTRRVDSCAKQKKGERRRMGRCADTVPECPVGDERRVEAANGYGMTADSSRPDAYRAAANTELLHIFLNT